MLRFSSWIKIFSWPEPLYLGWECVTSHSTPYLLGLTQSTQFRPPNPPNLGGTQLKSPTLGGFRGQVRKSYLYNFLNPVKIISKYPIMPIMQQSPIKTGFTFLLISSLMISLQNIITRVILSRQLVFGIEMGALISPNAGNSLLLLAMRMMMILPMMSILGIILYPRMWSDIKMLGQKTYRYTLISAIASGLCLFLSQLFIYIALGTIPTGFAIITFFFYPLITLPLAWLFFGDRPPLVRNVATIGMIFGAFLTIPSVAFSFRYFGTSIVLGFVCAVISSVSFAIYLILVQQGTQKLHPIPFSLIHFLVIAALAVLSLQLFPYYVQLEMFPQLWKAVFMLALTTMSGYLSSHFGIRLMGASRSGLISMLGPAFTSVLAVVIINERLYVQQIIGVFLGFAIATLIITFDRNLGAVQKKLTLSAEIVNRADEILAQRGVIDADNMRILSLDNVLLSQETQMLGLPKEAIEHLGLNLLKEVELERNTEITRVRIFQDAKVSILESQAVFNCIELPEGRQTQLGELHLATLGLKVDWVKKKLNRVPLSSMIE
jgi:drug/metabolite transporter (DMT)-like permease